jgi:hypothetical protein
MVVRVWYQPAMWWRWKLKITVNVLPSSGLD